MKLSGPSIKLLTKWQNIWPKIPILRLCVLLRPPFTYPTLFFRICKYLRSLSVIPYTLAPVFSFDDTGKSRKKWEIIKLI